MGRRLSLPADVADRRVSKLDLARDAAKLASQSMARQGNGVLGERQWSEVVGTLVKNRLFKRWLKTVV